MRLMILTIFAILVFIPLHKAYADCDPADFTISDVEKIDFSEAVKYSGFSTFNSSKSQNNNQRVDASSIIYGAPSSLSESDAKAISEHILSASGFNTSHDTRLSYVRTALSSVGENMYKDCKSMEFVNVVVPNNAYTDDSFFLTVKWMPQYSSHKEFEKVEIKIINGTVDGKDYISVPIRNFSSKTFTIEKSKKSIQISVSIDGYTPPIVTLPGEMKIKQFKVVRRTGIGNGSTGYGKDCTDHASLRDGYGSSAGDNPKTCDLCVNASPQGMLLTSTARVLPEHSPIGTRAEVSNNNNNLQACAEIRTDGAGKGTPDFVIDNATFSVWELIPAE